MWPVIVAVWCILVDVTSFWQKVSLRFNLGMCLLALVTASRRNQKNGLLTMGGGRIETYLEIPSMAPPPFSQRNMGRQAA